MQIAKLFCHTQLEGSLSRLARRINLTRYTLKTPLYFEPNFMFSLNIRFLSFYSITCKSFWFKLLFYLKNNVPACSLYIYEAVMKTTRLHA